MDLPEKKVDVARAHEKLLKRLQVVRTWNYCGEGRVRMYLICSARYMSVMMVR